MSFYKNKKVMVTGGGGFVGSFLVERLVGEGASVYVCDLRALKDLKNLAGVAGKINYMQADLTDRAQTMKVTENMDCVFSLAALVGGVEYNSKHPGFLFYGNILPNLLLLEAARINKVGRYLCVSSACVYPASASVPTPEEEGFAKEPEYTNRGYGWSKRVLELQARFYREEYGIDIAVVRPFNMYGPRDNFEKDKSHVVPALIKKVMEAEDTVEVWGTGSATRAFLYVGDAVRGIMAALEKYPEGDPVNIGTDEETSIADLTEMIIRLSGRKLKIKYLKDKPEGQPRRNCDNKKAMELLGFRAEIKLEEGLKKTIEWYNKIYGK